MTQQPLRMALNQPAHDTLHIITEWARGRDTIRAVLLTSTRAIPNARVDALSDYDVILVVEDIHPFAADRAWINDFGAVLVVYWDAIQPDPDVGIDYIANVTQYADGLKIDFTLWPIALFQQIVAAPALPAELDAGYRVLLDKDHLTATLRAPTARAYIPARPTNAEFQTWINDFWSDPPYVAKCLWRDELLPAKWCLDEDMKHIYLRQLLEWQIEIEHGWSLPTGFLGKGLKKHLSPATWAQLEASYAGAGLAENWVALANTMALFRQVAIQVGAQLGYAYPHDLDRRVSEYVEQIKRMEPPTEDEQPSGKLISRSQSAESSFPEGQ
jgi:aminoglycoside 6-adenylyltransferase